VREGENFEFFDLNGRFCKMKQAVRKKFWILSILALVILCVFSTAASALGKVSFPDGQYVKLGYTTAASPVWEAKSLPGKAVTMFLGAPLSTGGAYGDTNVWENSRVNRYLSETYLTEYFSQEELATGVLTPYGDIPIYSVVVHGTGYSSLAAAPDQGTGVEIPPSSAGDSLVWILDVQEVQSIYNGNPALPWDDAAGNIARLVYASGGPFRTRSLDPNNPSLIWTIGSDGSFSREPVSAPAVVRPVVSPDASVMLYKRGAGTQTNPYSVCYRWNVVPVVTADAKGSTITLAFPETVANNGAWPGSEAWRITDSRGTSYTVTGISGMSNKVTLTVYPAIAEGVTLTLRYAQAFDDASQGLNNTKGAILKTPDSQTPFLGFGLPDITLEASTGGDGDDDDGCLCDQNAGACLCYAGAILPGGCACGGNGCDNGAGLRIISDNVHYLVLGKPFVLDMEADGGTAPYAWSMGDGDLPEGLALSTEGSIEGTPTSPGSFRVTVRISDSAEKTASKRFTFIVVEDEALAIMTDTLPDAQVGLFWTARVRGCGGMKPYDWTLENLPAWLSFDPASGILSGTPAETAIYDLMVRVRDNEKTTDSKLLRLSVYPHDGLTVTTRVLPAAAPGKDYSARLEAFGGIPPHVFALRRGFSLPPGLTLDNGGVISGTPAQKGIYSFVVDAMDGNGLQGSAAYTMVVVDEAGLNPGAGGFVIRENEKNRQILLNFFLPNDFSDAEVLAVEPLVSPDAVVAGSSSTVKKEGSGICRVELTLRISEQALGSYGKSWKALVNDLVFEGFVVRFRDASGEAISFGKPLPIRDMKREEEGKSGSGGGGCNAVASGLAAFLPLLYCLRVKNAKGKK
jgi:hypothetical protein